VARGGGYARGQVDVPIKLHDYRAHLEFGCGYLAFYLV
jgi:hypothetical protein